jgi:hypothetical protein
MAPSNEFLADPAVVTQLAAHNPKLVRKTTVEFFDSEAPEVHLDFNRPVEAMLLSGFLGRYAEPDFTDGKVLVEDAAEHVYGDTVEYLLDRVTGMLKATSVFNKNHAVNGRIYMANKTSGVISRGDRAMVALDEIDAALDKAEHLAGRSARAQRRRIEAADRRAKRIAPDNRAELEEHRRERQAEIGRRTQLELEGGDQ